MIEDSEVSDCKNNNKHQKQPFDCDLSEVPALDEVSCKISGCLPMMHSTQVSPRDAWHLSSVNIVWEEKQNETDAILLL